MSGKLSGKPENEKIIGPGSYGGQIPFMHFKHKYIDPLGLTNELMGKYTLDICAGDSNYGAHVGNNVISVDSAANSYYQTALQNAQLDAENLPFDDNEFELIISSQGLPFIYHIAFETKEERENRRNEADSYDDKWQEDLNEDTVESKLDSFLNESIRVLKVGGQIRSWPIVEYPVKHATVKFKNLLDAKLNKLKEENKIDFKYEETEAGDDKDGNPLKVFRLIIIKK